MITDSRLYETQQRLTRHYLKKLHLVDEAMRRGQVNATYGLAIFDLEWEQIRHWQTWTTQRGPDDVERAELCKEFPLAGLEVLANRNSAPDHLAWLEAALDAAQQLQDHEAERALYYELEMTYYRLGSLDMINQCATQLLALGEAANDVLAMERALFGLAAYSEESGNYADAERYLQRSLQLASKLGDVVETGRVLNALGSVAGCVGNHQGAYQYFLRYLELMETYGQKSKICHALLSIGDSLISLKAYAEAEKYLQRAVSMCRTLGFQRFLGVGLLNLGTLAIEQSQLDMARIYLQEGLQAVRTLGVQRQIIYGLTACGYVDLRCGDCAAALEYLHEALGLAREGGRPRNVCDVQLALANTYLAMNDLQAAKSALYESLAIAERVMSHPQQVQCLSSVVAYLARLDHHEQAARLAGVIMGDPMIDRALFTPVCAQIESALGSARFQQALAQGQTQSLDDGVSEALAFLA